MDRQGHRSLRNTVAVGLRARPFRPQVRVWSDHAFIGAKTVRSDKVSGLPTRSVNRTCWNSAEICDNGHGSRRLREPLVDAAGEKSR
jgi:hypothetical protein